MEDHHARLPNTYNITSVPTMLVINTSGVVTWRGTAGWLHAPSTALSTTPSTAPPPAPATVEGRRERGDLGHSCSSLADEALKRFLFSHLRPACNSRAVAEEEVPSASEKAHHLAAQQQQHRASAQHPTPPKGSEVHVSDSVRAGTQWPWDHQDQQTWKQNEAQDIILLQRQRRAIQAGKRVVWTEEDMGKETMSGGYQGWRPTTVAGTHEASITKLLSFAFQRWHRRQVGVSPLHSPGPVGVSPLHTPVPALQQRLPL